MKILYISSLFAGFIHYPIVKIAQDNKLDYFCIFLQNAYTFYKDKEHPKHWNYDNISVKIPPDKYKIIRYFGLPKDLFMQYYWIIPYLLINVKEKYDLIHAHCLYPSGYLAMKLSEKLNIPFIVTTHGTDFYNLFPKNSKAYYNQKMQIKVNNVLNNANQIIAVSQNFADDIAKYNPKTKLSVIENTYNSTIFKHSKSISKDFQTINFICVGNFNQNKNHFLLLNAFKDSICQHSNIHLKIIGGGILKEKYLEFITKYNLQDFIQIKDYMPHQDLINEYLSSDIFILPSISEAFGVVILEAFATGLAVISSNTQGPSSIIDNYKNGILFENNNKDSLLKAIDFLVSDQSALSQMKTNAIRKAKQYEKKYNDVYSIYQKVLNNER